jgi:hypothetical protein
VPAAEGHGFTEGNDLRGAHDFVAFEHEGEWHLLENRQLPRRSTSDGQCFNQAQPL